jgi:hypothetical protein
MVYWNNNLPDYNLVLSNCYEFVQLVLTTASSFVPLNSGGFSGVSDYF